MFYSVAFCMRNVCYVKNKKPPTFYLLHRQLYWDSKMYIKKFNACFANLNPFIQLTIETSKL